VTPDKPEPLEFYGVLALQNMLSCGTPGIHRKLGEPDGTLRWGCMEAPIWLADRALGVPCRDIPSTNWYTASEGARLVGVGKNTFKRIMPESLGCVISGKLYGKRSNRIKPLWTEAQCYEVRRRIKEGSIAVHWRQLTRPLFGAVIAPPRHCLAENQGAETETYRKAYPFAALSV
jgi:hypothetical protein